MNNSLNGTRSKIRVVGVSAFLLTVISPLCAQNFVYTNDGATPNTVSGWSVSSAGALTPLAGSPYQTKGSAGALVNTNFAASRIVTSSAGSALFAANESDGTISGFAVNPQTGVLTISSNGPIQSGLGACPSGISLAISYDGQYLVAGSGCTNKLSTFYHAGGGTLYLIYGNSLVSSCGNQGATGSIAFAPNDSFVEVANSVCMSIESFSMGGSGVLQGVPGSPFALGTGSANPAFGVAVSCNSSLVVAGEAQANNGNQSGQLLNSFTLGSDGSLTSAPGQPYAGRSLSSPAVAFAPSNSFVFASSKVYNSLASFSAAGTGALAEIQTSPAPDTSAPGNISVSNDGLFLFVANGGSPGIGVYAIDASGTLTQVSGSPVSDPGGNTTGAFESVAAFPSPCITPATVAVSPNYLSFDGPIGKTTPAQTITFTNIGSSPVTFNSVAIGNAAVFADPVNNCVGTVVAPGASCTLQMTFAPANDYVYEGSINLNSDGSPATLSVELDGTGENVATPNVVFSPPNLAFGNVNVGGSATQGLSITNNGTSDLHITSATTSGPFTFTSSCVPSTVTAGSSCGVQVTFSPTTDIAVTGSLTLNDDAGSGQQTVSLAGAGVAVSGPALSISPDSISFGPTMVGTSHVQSVTLTNTGTQALVISSLGLTDTTDYSYATGCAITLQPGVFCVFSISYHPQTNDAGSATLLITSNVTEPNGIPLSGQGTTSCTPDTDGDGICDDWETNGYYARINNQDVFIDLPSMGADPMHKDIFVQADYMQVDKPSPNAHTHKPLPGTDTLAEAMFNAAPVTNPDLSTGIHLHVDCGPDCVMNPVTGAKWGMLSRATQLAELNPFANIDMTKVPYDWTNFDADSTAFNQTGRLWTFHHVMFVHALDPSSFTSGVSRNTSDFTQGASDFLVALGDASPIYRNATAYAGTMAHELGHNLGLQHGGADSFNGKPNYLSLMNYNFQLLGLIFDGTRAKLNYSDNDLPSLNKLNLQENAGLGAPADDASYGTIWTCPTGSLAMTKLVNGPENWDCSTDSNGNPTFQQSVSADINGDTSVLILNGYNDWANLVYMGGAIGANGASLNPTTVMPELPSNTPANFVLNSVAVESAQAVSMAPGSSAAFAFTIENNGMNDDTYNLTAGGPAGWIDGSSLPATLTVPGGQSVVVQAQISVPPGTADGTFQFVSVMAASPSSTATGASQFAVYASSTASPAVISTDTLNAGAVTLGNAPSTTRVTLANSGTTPLSISSLAITGDFNQTSDCGDAVAAGASCVITVSFSPTAAGARTGTLTITDSAPDSPQVVDIQGTAVAAATNAPQIGAVVNASTSLRGGVSAGSLFALYGLSLAPNVSTPTGLPLPTELSGAMVTFNGVQAPLLYAGATQINGQVPYGIPEGTLTVVITRADGGTATADVDIVAIAPGFFEFYGGQHLAAQNLDYSVNSTTHPAHPGGYIITYFTGQGALDQTVTTGEPGPTSPVANTAAKTTATVGGVAATVTFSGLAPYEVGVAQADIQIPAAGPGGAPWTVGDYPVVLTIGGVVSDTGLISIAP